MTFICTPFTKTLGIATLMVAMVLPAAISGTYGTASSTTGGSLDDQARREVVRRQEAILKAESLEKAGDIAVKNGDFEAGYGNYLNALDLIGSGEVVDGTRSRILAKFSKTGISYSEALIAKGRYTEAEQVAKTILLPQYNPTYRPAVVLLSNLEQPDYYNKTVTPQFAADREEVSRLLVEAEGYFTRGSFDLSTLRYEQVLNIDRYNIAARKGIEKVENAKENYAGVAYNETRSRMLWQVTKAWELPVRKLQTGRSTAGSQIQVGGTGAEAITAKLNRIIIPRIDLRDTTVREAVEYLRTLSVSLDTLESDPVKRGVNIFLKLPAGGAGAGVDPALPTEGFSDAAPTSPVASADTRVTLALNGVPLYEALRYLAQLSGLKIKVEDFAVAIVPLTDISDELLTKEYSVPPTFIPSTPPEGETSSFGAVTPSDTSRVGRRPTAQQYLASQGVVFPEGSSANYIASGSRLIVRNTLDNIDLIDVLVDASVGAAPTQVEIESKFVEINQNNLKELGFDWLLGPVQLGSSGAYAAGGDGILGNTSAYPFNSPGGGPIGQFPVTNGLRSGVGSSANSAVSTNSVDALLAGLAQGTSLAAPGIFALSGIYSNPQFQLVIRALDQKKGIDLMSAPKVTTKSGLKAVVNIVREFIYPSEFDPPQIPQANEGDDQNSNGGGPLITGGFEFPNGIITPTTPTAFETRNTGVMLDVLPTVGNDGYTIDLEITPEVVDFDGFVNYGSPILGIRPVSTGIGGLVTGIETFTLTPNVINQPIFTVRKVNTKVTIWDGSTVALGGLIREDVQKVQDKVPVLGDIPLVGRLFRSDVDQKIKKNLIIFVTARMMDAEGKPLRSDFEEEDIVEPLGLPDDLPRPVIQVKSAGAGK
jgi:general secretion pathway protein D